MSQPSRRIRVLQAGCVLVVFLPVLLEWASYVSKVSRLGYTLLVPVLAACLALASRRRPARGAGSEEPDPGREETGAKSLSSGLASGLFLGSAALLAVGAGAGLFTLQIAAFPVAVLGLLAAWGGTPLLLRQARALSLLFFLVPVPLPLLDGSNPLLVGLSGTLAAAQLSLLDPASTWIGNELTFQGWTLIVADACSGSGTTLVLLVLSLFLSGLFGLGPGRTVVLFLGVLPLSLAVNGLRIAATAVMLAQLGPASVSGLPHELLGQGLVIATVLLLVRVVLAATREPAETRTATP